MSFFNRKNLKRENTNKEKKDFKISIKNVNKIKIKTRLIKTNLVLNKDFEKVQF